MVSLTSGKDQDQVDWSADQWKNRLPILFSPSEDDGVYQAFKKRLQKRTQEIGDRDLLIIYVFESGEGRLDYLHLNKDKMRYLRKRF